jgi:hypothetical protein
VANVVGSGTGLVAKTSSKLFNHVLLSIQLLSGDQEGILAL